MIGLSEELVAYLKACGISDEAIGESDLNTRLYQDLGIYGDEAIESIKCLAELYDVDLSEFTFELCFPAEFPGNSGVSRFLIWFFPWVHRFSKPEEDYKPITLTSIEAVISKKKWFL